VKSKGHCAESARNESGSDGQYGLLLQPKFLAILY
jgi:hypothetical protein